MLRVMSLVPRKVTLAFQDIESEADFDGIAFDPEKKRDAREIEQMFKAIKSKDFNVTQAEFEALRTSLEAAKNGTLEEKAQAASKAVQQLLIGRYRAYHERGLAGLEPYNRGQKTVDIAQELQTTTQTLDVVEKHLPAYYQTLLDYPQGAECCEHRFRWVKLKLLKRVGYALVHTSTLRTDKLLIITERHYYYYTHSLNSLQITVGWVPYEEGTYMGLAMSAQADALETMLAKTFRNVGRDKAAEMLGDVLADIRDLLEGTKEASGKPVVDVVK